MKKFKLNDSFTTYVIDEKYIEYLEEHTLARPPEKSNHILTWQKGAKVFHWHHGKGEIIDITDEVIVVRFFENFVRHNRRMRKDEAIVVLFDATTVKNDSLKLC